MFFTTSSTLYTVAYGLSNRMMDQGNTQTALFSATYNPKVMEFAKKIIKEPELITVKTEELSLENIHQYFVTVNNDEDKLKSLRALYGAITVDNAIVFCRVSPFFFSTSERSKPSGASAAGFSPIVFPSGACFLPTTILACAT